MSGGAASTPQKHGLAGYSKSAVMWEDFRKNADSAATSSREADLTHNLGRGQRAKKGGLRTYFCR